MCDVSSPESASLKNLSAALLASVSLCAFATTAYAQVEADTNIETVVVTGSRAAPPRATRYPGAG